MKKQLSECCGAEMKVVCGEDFPGDRYTNAGGQTCHYECLKCHKSADIQGLTSEPREKPKKDFLKLNDAEKIEALKDVARQANEDQRKYMKEKPQDEGFIGICPKHNRDYRKCEECMPSDNEEKPQYVIEKWEEEFDEKFGLYFVSQYKDFIRTELSNQKEEALMDYARKLSFMFSSLGIDVKDMSDINKIREGILSLKKKC